MIPVADWFRNVKNAGSDRLRHHPVAYARALGLLSAHPLPPGDLVALDLLEKADRNALRQRADQLGPVFKGIAWDALCVCIVGIDRCRRFTQAHRAALRVQTMELEHLIPKGFICAMEGDDHREIRKSTNRALRNVSSCPREVSRHTAVLESIAETGLRDYVARSAEHGNSADDAVG